MTRTIKFFLYFYLCVSGMWVHAEPIYPVDISYLVADFKYSQEHGLKICEVQHGALSALNGDIFVAGENGTITPKFSDFFSQIPTNKWVAGLSKLPMRIRLHKDGWGLYRSFSMLTKNSTFHHASRNHPEDPSSIDSYSGIVYATTEIARDYKRYRNAYPGIIFMDAATVPYWIDKYKMNLLFDQNALLSECKAEWKLYPRRYDAFLSKRIQEDLPSELYVIKPRGAFKGNGVIIVASDELDEVLKTILEPTSQLKNHSNKHYSYWGKNRDTTFLVEKFYRSDYLNFSDRLSNDADALPSQNEEGYHYDATMRIAFILMYDKGQMSYQFLGGYWKLPSKALEENGTHNEKRISCGFPPFYRAVDPEILDEANAQLKVAMLLLYDIMLTGGSE